MTREISEGFADYSSEGFADSSTDGASADGAIAPRTLSYSDTLLAAATVGIVGGLVATVYYSVIEHLLEVVWGAGREAIVTLFPLWLPHWHYTWLVATVGGLGVGLCLHFLGLPGEMAIVIDQVHDTGDLDQSQTPGMIATSIVSIVAGGSLGPEAPLVQINGSMGSWLAQKLALTMESARILTFCGMGAALSAFFCDPIGGPLFALEIPHRRGLEYYEAIIPTMVSGICSFAVFRAGTGLAVGGIYNFGRFGDLPTLSWVHLVEGLLLGIAGALAGILFIGIFRGMHWMIQKIEHRHILLAVLGGLGIGWIAVLFPATLFFSEHQIESQLLAKSASYGVVMLLCLCLAKMFAICFTIHGGFRGGFIFPLFFTGASLGLAIAFGIPGLHPTIAVLCCMAALNVAITKTPVSTTIILTVLSDTTILPVIAIASFASFLLTSNMWLLETQRSRVKPGFLRVADP